jgi:hypothetical protein
MTPFKAVVLIAVGAVCVAAVSSFCSHKAALANRVRVEEVRNAIALPGTGLDACSDGQLVDVSARIGCRLGTDATPYDVLNCLRGIRVRGEERSLKAFANGRTLYDVCRRIGTLVLRRQQLEQYGRRAEVSSCLKAMKQARDGGALESEVESMARAAVLRGDLVLSGAEECQRIDNELDELAGELVEGTQELVQIAAAS